MKKIDLKHFNSSTLIKAVLLFIVVILVFQPTANFEFLWDDHQHIQANRNFGSGEGLAKIWFSPGATSQYYPLTFSVFWFIDHFFGLDPVIFHLVNVLLHAANAVLIFIILKSLGLKASFWAALFFAIHPVVVETVAWPMELKNLLSVFFYLITFLFYLRFYGSFKTRDYLFSILFFICALLSKTTALSFPVIFLIMIWWKNNGISKKDAGLLLPFFAIAIALGRITAMLEKTRVGASGPEWDFSIFERILIAGRALWFYAVKLIFPVDFMFIYPRWEIDVSQPLAWFFPVSIIALLFLLFVLRHKIGKGPLASLLFFIITLLPALGFINFYPMLFSFVADHFQYLASAGIIVLISEILVRAKIPKILKNLILCIYACVLILGTYSYLPAFKSQIDLWTDTIKKNPAAWLAYANRGVLRISRGQIREALDDYDNALRLVDDADIRFNRGNAYLALNDYKKAAADFSRAIKLYPHRDSYYNNRGSAYFRLEEYENALNDFKYALRINKRNAFAWANMGKTYWAKGDNEIALQALNKSIELGADYDEIYFYRSKVYSAIDRLEEALIDAKNACLKSGDETYCQHQMDLEKSTGQISYE